MLLITDGFIYENLIIKLHNNNDHTNKYSTSSKTTNTSLQHNNKNYETQAKTKNIPGKVLHYFDRLQLEFV